MKEELTYNDILQRIVNTMQLLLFLEARINHNYGGWLCLHSLKVLVTLDITANAEN